MNYKRKRQQNIIIIALFLVAILMATGYAVYSTSLAINSVGKVYSDWDIRFTDVSVFASSGATAIGEVAGTSFNDIPLSEQTTLFTDLGITDFGDNLGGIILNVVAELAADDDYVEFVIDVTNFSSLWNANLVSLSPLAPGANDFIQWSLYDADGYELAPNALAAGFLVEKEDTVAIILRAEWNPAKYGQIPVDAIKKESETDTNLSHTEEKAIVLVFEAATPTP